ncbi:MAG: DUF3604 domain-containing protein [Chlamydiia bacterium]|nr:DUF3604 domain-containing protein [Chlamydiia bacterium]
MRRSICHSEPQQILAGETSNWTFVYTTATALPKGTSLRFDMRSHGRDIDWELPDAGKGGTSNRIFITLPDGKSVSGKEVTPGEKLLPQYEFVLPCQIPAGESVAIRVGSEKKTGGNRAQKNAQRRRHFHLYIDPKGKGHYGNPEVFSVDVKGAPLHTIKIFTPSQVIRNKRFDIIVRFEDEFGNLTNNAPEDTLIELTYENIRENLNWKLFVPETGYLVLPNLYFNEIGVYVITLNNLRTKEKFSSSPILCVQESSSQTLWGHIHGESERYDSTESIESCVRHFRDELAHQFFCASPPENEEETPNETWKLISQTVTEFNEDERFAGLIGFQWAGEKHKEGIRQVLYAKDGKPLLRHKDSKGESLEKLYGALSAKESLAIPCFTMGGDTGFNFKSFNPEFERVVEIYNAWGSSECTEKEGNPFPISGSGRKCTKEWAGGSVLDALKKNCRFGFVAGGLDDRGIYKDFFDGGQKQYTPGLTAILAKEQSRSAIFEALQQRSCYATTGPRIVISFTIAGMPMGSEISTRIKPGIAVNRHICVTIAGTAPLKAVEIVRNGKVLHTLSSKTYHLTFEYDDLEPLASAAIKNSGTNPFAFYYLRVYQEDGHAAWSSPIWIDELPPVKKEAEKAK